MIYTPESTAEALASHPTKRRRAKRTEEERIDYLRADPYVAQFEAYRVLCASCDKWIRLRPNSTYCSIPWDAHRKSCLAKKMFVSNVASPQSWPLIFSPAATAKMSMPSKNVTLYSRRIRMYANLTLSACCATCATNGLLSTLTTTSRRCKNGFSIEHPARELLLPNST